MIVATGVSFVIEILLGEMIFLFGAEKRPHFVPRLVLGWSLSLLLGVNSFIPATWTFFGTIYPVYFITLFFVTIAAHAFCFRMHFSALLSHCVMGYAVQHGSYQVTMLLDRIMDLSALEWFGLSHQRSLELAVFPVIYLLVFVTMGLYAARHEWTRKGKPAFNIVSLLFLLNFVGLNRMIRVFGEYDCISVRLYAIVCCLLMIVVQYVLYRYEDLRLENMMVNRLWQEDKKHFEQSKEVMDAFNIKYHDLHHRISMIKGSCSAAELDALCQQAESYAANIKTGNDAMDVLLTEYSSTCTREGIELTYMGRGADLNFMETVDVYSLLGNALANAIEAVRLVDDPEKRIIHITTERRGDLLNIEVVNYYAATLRMENSLPATTKADNGFHGFGMKSIQLIAKKYGGELRIDTEGNLFELCIVLMAA